MRPLRATPRVFDELTARLPASLSLSLSLSFSLKLKREREREF